MSSSRFLVSTLWLAALASAQSIGTFTPTGSMTTPRYGHRAILLADGRVLIAGGYGSAPLPAEVYDPSTGTFTGIPWNGGTPQFLLPDTRVVVVGGRNGVEIYDPSTSTFAVWNGGYPWMSMPDGRILTGDAQGNMELYDLSTGTNTDGGNIPSSLLTWISSVTPLISGKILITRYEDDSACGKVPIPYPLAFSYDPFKGTFAETTGNMITNHAGPTTTLLMNGKVLIAGGDPCDGEPGSPYAELYDPAARTFAATGYMAVGREDHTATLLPDGSVLVTGGHICCINLQLQASAELYDPVAGTFQSAGYMTAGRARHTATLLRDGRVLITGGYQANQSGISAVVSSAEIYTPPNPVPAAALLSLSGDGKNQGAVQHAGTYQLVSAENPATAGEAIIIYCTGLIDGSVIPPQVAIGGKMAEVLWFGNTPGYPGLNQINVRVPDGVEPGPAVPVRINYIGRPSNQVTIGVR